MLPSRTRVCLLCSQALEASSSGQRPELLPGGPQGIASISGNCPAACVEDCHSWCESHSLSYQSTQSLSDLAERQTGEQGDGETDRQREQAGHRERRIEGAGSTDGQTDGGIREDGQTDGGSRHRGSLCQEPGSLMARLRVAG